MAIVAEAPIIGVFDSAGAKVLEGVEALAAYGSVMACAANADVPQIAIVAGQCSGHAAIIAQMFDFVIAAKSTGKLYTTVAGEKLGNAEALAKDGVAALVAENDADALAKARKLVSYFEGELITGDEINRLVSADVVSEGYDVHSVIETVFDAGSFTELYAEKAPAMVCGLATMNGHVVAVVANNPAFKGGHLCGGAADKAAAFIEKCDAQDIPVVTLVDSCGLDVSGKAEENAYASELAKLAYAYTTADNAKVTAVVGKAYGAAFTLLGSKSVGADMVFALENAAISVLSPEASVAFVWNSKVGVDGKTREELENEWKEKCASAAEAADAGEIDDIIEMSELRKRICSALQMLSAKACGKPSRRHANMPL
jgi:acetyl-CoA carboxylase carboxyltransferase component